MTKIEIIRNCIKSVKESGKVVNIDNVITASLFQPHGTLTIQDEDLILAEFEEIRQTIEKKVNRKYKPEGAYIPGFAVAIAVNSYFNQSFYE